MKCFTCPCCGFLTRSKEAEGTFEICPICNWEDDDVQFENPDFSGGANEESLNEAQENFRKYEASHPRYLKQVRKPLPEEIP